MLFVCSIDSREVEAWQLDVGSVLRVRPRPAQHNMDCDEAQCDDTAVEIVPQLLMRVVCHKLAEQDGSPCNSKSPERAIPLLDKLCDGDGCVQSRTMHEPAEL